MMALDYCRARQLDPLLKPVHLVPMSVKDSRTGKSEWRDVVMPGIGLYRIQADRSGDYAGAREPEFGPDVTQTLTGVEVTFPQWCKYTVYKRMPSGEIVEFSAKEYWIELRHRRPRHHGAERDVEKAPIRTAGEMRRSPGVA
jgi:phage recombination protein Bet